MRSRSCLKKPIVAAYLLGKSAVGRSGDKICWLAETQRRDTQLVVSDSGDNADEDALMTLARALKFFTFKMRKAKG